MTQLDAAPIPRDTAAAFALALVGLVAVYVRLKYGVDFQDEAFYVAMPYRFVLGDRPFIDELNAQQFSAALTYPLIKAWYSIHGNLDGVILFLRRSYVPFSVLVGISVFWTVRPKLGTSIALLIGSLPLMFAPFNIATFSYNTLGMGLLTIGLFVSFGADDSKFPSRSYFAAGIAHGLACIAYPSLSVIPMIELGVIWVFASTPFRTSVAPYAAAVGAIGLVCVATMLSVGFEHAMAAIEYTSSGPPKFVDPFQGFASQLRMKGFAIGWLALAIGCFAFARRLAFVFVATLPIVLYASLAKHEGHTNTLFFIIYLGLVAPLFGAFVGDTTWVKKLLGWIWLPSIVAGLAFSATSATGFWNSSLGLLPAALVTMIFAAAAIQRSMQPVPAIWAALLCVAVTNGVLLFSFWNAVYGDAPIERLTDTVSSGPYAGMRTTPSRHKMLTDISKALQRYESRGARILVYDAFAAGYLLTSMPPATNSTWLLDWPYHRNVYAEGFSKNLDPRNVVLQINARCQPMVARDPLREMVEAQHALIVDRLCYRVFSGARDSAASEDSQ